METSGHIFPITRAVLVIVFAYLIGSIPMGLIVGHVVKGIDIREHGSGNIGLTNVIRTLGWGPGLVTGLLDFFKGYLPVAFVMSSFSPDSFSGVAAVYETTVILVALLIVVGNLFPVYLMFKGGKGVATGFGVASALIGVYIFIPLAVFAVFLLVFRMVSVASICAAVSAPLTVVLLSSHMGFVSESRTAYVLVLMIMCLLAVLILWSHRSNVGRIISGREPRVHLFGRKLKAGRGEALNKSPKSTPPVDAVEPEQPSEAPGDEKELEE
jgi:glycerol-3-phosphate acyltransferase PlsY